MAKIFLDKAKAEYKQSFYKYIESYLAEGETSYYDKYKMALDNFHEYIKLLEKEGQGTDLPKDRVAQATFWSVDDNFHVLGVTRIRKQTLEFGGNIGYDIAPAYRKKGYGSLILKLALIKAREMNLQKAIVTCEVDNIASKKIIEKNKGIFIGSLYSEEMKSRILKYEMSLGITR
ncbi:GNAT family N-acetyltransferase [Oenococcus oeni]|uniref:GNAT family N-acetyltransferase n=1 Tax=Oenococcus oeni TaxID=1247 RepID=UPI000BDF3A02|nr:GNAT family N-acetyltransferase [Oenococcus oeni]PDH96704.1 acetyltransferase [Oenococcus oeni]